MGLCSTTLSGAGALPVRQHQGLAGLDLAAGVLDHFAVDEDQALFDQALGLAARTDARSAPAIC